MFCSDEAVFLPPRRLVNLRECSIPFSNQDENAKASEQRRTVHTRTARSRTAQPTKLTLDLKLE